MLRFRTKDEAVSLMNYLGGENRPFLFIIDYKQQLIYIEELDAIDPSVLCYQFGNQTNKPSGQGSSPSSFSWETDHIPFQTYKESFHYVISQIHAGNSYLVNLTCPSLVRTSLSLYDIYLASSASYKLWVKGLFTVFSPECFVRIEGNRICSHPMKGTIDASVPDAYERIMADPKEAAEHATIVDLIRNDLSIVASNVQVARYRYVDEISTNNGRLLQVSSKIEGLLPENWKSGLGNLLFDLLPAGSITGAPKQKTIEIIAQTENYERGFYTGVMGIFDGHNLDSSVMIRFMEQQGKNTYLFKSGGGITSQSDCVSEYEEMKQKVYVPIY